MKVLVIESDDTVQKSTGVMLNKLGYKAGLASDCDEALRMHRSEGPFDLVLIALKFVTSSKGGGTRLLDELRQETPTPAIAFMTSSPVLKKPFSLQELDDFLGGFRRPGQSRFG